MIDTVGIQIIEPMITEISDHSKFHQKKRHHDHGKSSFFAAMDIDGTGGIDQIDIKHRSQGRMRKKVKKRCRILEKSGNGICSRQRCGKVIDGTSQCIYHDIEQQKDKEMIVGTADMPLNAGVNQTTQADQKACDIKRRIKQYSKIIPQMYPLNVNTACFFIISQIKDKYHENQYNPSPLSRSKPPGDCEDFRSPPGRSSARSV